MSLTPATPSAHHKHSHCSTCGAPYGDATGWPRTCQACGDVAYRNPLPVAVALLPVAYGTGKDVSGADGTGADSPGTAEGVGLVVITRTIAPARGAVALPGGFVDHREDWRRAVVRELHEETGIEAAMGDVRLADALSSPDGHLLLFGLLPPRTAGELPPPTPTAETDGWHVLRAPGQLGFPLHTIAVRQWFAGRYANVAR
ncbi:NUDIX domain-containing protein [Streptomyces sp. NBC_01304]|uniref:NUDIX domain-containing protein n=1 Tax=Streptomyces sp. NBC_01304 TaxID=2903818 RepID=UPI002E1525AF|nr:NUDIX domain-containing protein [Streptomyces sp. NBC_01304]